MTSRSLPSAPEPAFIPFVADQSTSKMDQNTTSSATSSPARIPSPRGYALSGKIMLAIIVALFSFVLLILFVHLYARFHLIRRRRRLNRRLISTSGDHTSAVTTPRGLDPTVLNSLAVTVFSSEDADVSTADCAVCLDEFEDGEKVRILPRCDHGFHIGCIDIWFGSHSSCPLCRTPVEIEPPAEEKAIAGRQCADPDAGSSSNSVSIEIADREEELGLGFPYGVILAVKRFWGRERGVDLERGNSPTTATAGQ